MRGDVMCSGRGIKKSVKPGLAEPQKRCDRRELKLGDAMYLWNISPAAVMEQPINLDMSVLQAAVCDSGVPRKVLPLYESRGGGAALRHRVQAETSCGPRDQNPCATGAATFSAEGR